MNNKIKTPPKWVAVYPQGSKEGDEEQAFFISLSRHKKYEWRSVAHMAKETNLSKERVEEIINKYWKKGMIFQNPINEDLWGYWERIPKMIPEQKESITEVDHNTRIDNAGFF